MRHEYPGPVVPMPVPMPGPMVPMVHDYFAPENFVPVQPEGWRGRSRSRRSPSPAPRTHGGFDQRPDCVDFMAGRPCAVTCPLRHREVARGAQVYSYQVCRDFAAGAWYETFVFLGYLPCCFVVLCGVLKNKKLSVQF
jgi:hypothetical protein